MDERRFDPPRYQELLVGWFDDASNSALLVGRMDCVLVVVVDGQLCLGEMASGLIPGRGMCLVRSGDLGTRCWLSVEAVGLRSNEAREIMRCTGDVAAFAASRRNESNGGPWPLMAQLS